MLTKFKLPNNIQIIPFELNLRKGEWFFVSIYKSPLQNNQYFVSILSDLLDFYPNEYDSSSVSVHQRHLCFLVTEIYKSRTRKNPKFMWPYFTYNNITYNLRKEPILYLPSMHSTYYGTNSIHFRWSLIWNKLPRDIKSSKSVSEFEVKIKNFGNVDCGCVICS